MKTSIVKTLSCIILTLIPGIFTMAGNPPKAYFNTTPGRTMHYERYGQDGKFWWTQDNGCTAVTQREDGSYDVSFTVTVTEKEVKPTVAGTFTSVAVYHPDGTIEVDMSSAMLTAAKTKFSILNFDSVQGGTSKMAATVREGDVLEEIHSGVSWAGIRFTVDYFDRVVDHFEYVTVPAGTYYCAVVKEHKIEKAPFHKRDRITYTWYALGLGLIRHDTHFLDGRRECSEQLVKID